MGRGDTAAVTVLLERVRQARTASDLQAVVSLLTPVLRAETHPSAERERRLFERRPCPLVMRVLEDGSHGMHFVRDISLGGISVHIQAPLPLFPELHCQLPLYEEGVVHTFTARVVWCQPDPPARVGMQFVGGHETLMEWLLSSSGS